MKLDGLVKLNAARQARQAVVVATNLTTGAVDVMLEADMAGCPLSDAARNALNSGKASTLDLGEASFFLNPYIPPPRIVVIGAVHISQALAGMAAIAGYDLTIIDPRRAFATAERFVGVPLVPEWPEDVLKSMPLDGYTAVAALTHDPKIDDFPLSEALKANCFYVGALGSRKTHARRVERLKELGHSDEQISRIAAPIGLDIGSSSPAEIALATLAQIVKSFRQRNVAVS